MKKHIVILNVPKYNYDEYCLSLLKQIRLTKDLKNLDVIFVTTRFKNGIADTLTEEGAVHKTGRSDCLKTLKSANADKADYIIVIADKSDNEDSDSKTFNILSLLEEINTDANIVAECVNIDNKVRFLRHGATAVIRPIRAYPEMTIRAMTTPGSETLIENMFSSQGDELVRVDVDIKCIWGNISHNALKNNLGIPLGYVNRDSEFITNPDYNSTVSGIAIILLVKEGRVINIDQIKSLI